MDERIERLRRVELEALGTARREFISTADSKKARNARIEELERERMSNIPGTDAKRVAEAHQSQLEDWANVYKKIGDTGDLEHLDNLLNGQSHRHHLSTVVRESGGQEYIKPDNPAKGAGKGGSNLQAPASNPPGPAKNAGKGNDAFVQKRADSKSLKSTAPERTSIPRRSLSVSQKGQSGLDPALDANNRKKGDENTRNKEAKARANKRKTVPHAVVKFRRPIGDFEGILTSPESFLAAARGFVNARASRPTVNDISETDPQSSHVEQEKNNATQNHSYQDSSHLSKDPSNLSSQASHSDSFPSSEPSQPSNPEIEAPTTPRPKVAVHMNTNKSDGDEWSKSTTLESSEERVGFVRDKPRIRSRDSQDIPKPKRTPIRAVKKPSLAEEVDRILESCANSTEEILVDLSITPPSSGKGQGAILMSPALEELKGLEFTMTTYSQGGPPPRLYLGPDGRTELQETTVTEDKANNDDSSTLSTKSKKAPSVDDYQHQIDILCELMASTSLSDIYLTKLKECKDELEARFHLAQTHSLTRTATEQSTKDFAVEELTNSKLDGVASAKPNLSKDRDVESNGSSPQVRLSAKAPQFVPKRSSSAAIQAKTERYSEAKHELAEYVIERAHAELNVSSLRESHIFGNHLLPGRYRSQPPKTNVSEQSSPSPSERKISSKRPGLFLSPPPSSPRVRDENSSSFEVSHKAPATPKAPPQSIEAREVLSEQIMDRNAQASSSPRPKNETKRVIDTMQQSIHAPKLRKEPFGQGLDSSKYARPKYP